MRRSETAALLLVATLTLSTLATTASASIAPAAGPEISPGSTAELSATDVLEQAEAALAGEAATQPAAEPSASGGEVVESPTLALADLTVAYDELTPSEQRRADQLLARPDGTGNPAEDIKTWSNSAVEATPDCGPNVCVHYVTNTDDATEPGWAATTRSVMESVWNYEINTLGYRAPASDGIKGEGAGGDTIGKFDVYLSNLGVEGYYGYCAGESPVSGQQFRQSGYCVLDNDFAEFLLSPSDSLKVTAAHEFFHAIQFNYDAAEDRWLMEATATWIEERYADSVNDNRQYLRHGQLAKPAQSLDTFGGLTHYGNWLFFERISAKYGVDAVRSIWNRLDASTGAADQFSIQAVKNYLASQGTTLPKFYANFAAANLAPGRNYSEGSAYRAARVTDGFKLKAGRKSIAPKRVKLRHLTSKSYRFKAGNSLRGKWKLRINIDAPARKTGPAVVVNTYLKSGKITKKNIRLSKSGNGTAKVKLSHNNVVKVTLTLANASSRFHCWEQATYSCQGYSKDDRSFFTFAAKAVR